MPPTEAPPKPADLDEKRREAEGDEAPPNGDGPVSHEGASGAGEMEGEGKDEQGPPPLEIAGLGKQLTLEVGGRKPDTSQVKLRSTSIATSAGQFEKGQTVDLVIRARCTAVEVLDKIDGQTGEVTETVRRHTFKAVGVEKL